MKVTLTISLCVLVVLLQLFQASIAQVTLSDTSAESIVMKSVQYRLFSFRLAANLLVAVGHI